MKLMIRFLLGAGLALCIGGNLPADGVETGSVDQGFLLKSDGFWYDGAGDPHTRTSYTVTTYYRDAYGCLYPSTSYKYTYSRAAVKTIEKEKAYTPPPAPEFKPGWKEKLLDNLNQRDEYQTYLKALDLAGYKGQSYDPYPQAHAKPGLAAIDPSQPGMANNVNLGSFGVNGNTIMGYSSRLIAEQYGDNALPLMQQAYAQSVQASQSSGTAAQRGLGALAFQEQKNRAEIVRMFAQTEATRRIWEPQSSAKLDLQYLKIDGDAGSANPSVIPPVNPTNPVVPNPSLGQFWSASATQNCISCHAGTKLEGGYDVTKFPSMTADKQSETIFRLTTRDVTKRMPKDHPALPPGQIAVWMQVAASTQSPNIAAPPVVAPPAPVPPAPVVPMAPAK